MVGFDDGEAEGFGDGFELGSTDGWLMKQLIQPLGCFLCRFLCLLVGNLASR